MVTLTHTLHWVHCIALHTFLVSNIFESWESLFSSKNSNASTFTLKNAKSITSKDIILKGSAKIFSNLTHLKVNNEMEIVVIVAKIVESRFPLMILILRTHCTSRHPPSRTRRTLTMIMCTKCTFMSFEHRLQEKLYSYTGTKSIICRIYSNGGGVIRYY